MSINNPVKTLNAEVARKIAAGEVIDRPNAIIRELMDNAIDSGATSITVEISSGGIEKIRVIDNGCGMTKEDLQNCAKPHATSKISTEIDLMNLTTLGFRGEALASIAAVARLTILSGNWKMRSNIVEDHIIEPGSEVQGTIVQSEGLFENFPARRQFLKRPATEALMCKNTFIEKAMTRPDIAFTFVQDGEQKINLPGNQDLKDRFIQANSYLENSSLFFVLSNESKDFSFDVVIGEPAISRSNKKEIVVYTNGRKIQEYALVQAVEYGGQGFFPNGTYPVAAVFIKMNPNLVDFNIHPAKREARFYDLSELHHALSSTIKNFFRTYTKANFDEDKPTDEVRQFEFDNLTTVTKSNPQTTSQSNISTGSYERHISYKSAETGEKNFNDFRSKYLGGKENQNKDSDSSSDIYNPNTRFNKINEKINEAIYSNQFENSSDSDTDNSSINSSYTFHNLQNLGKTENSSSLSLAEQALQATNENMASQISKQAEIKYVGMCLGTFLLAEKNNCLYLIDQHAAHERILFDKLMNTQGHKQELLIPYKIKTESKTQDNQLSKLQSELNRIGFTTIQIKDGEWEITSIPERWTGTEYDLRTLLFVKNVEPKEIIRSIAAMTACKAAIKDGYVIDVEAAKQIIEKTFTLEDPHCPHGRPIYTVISREKLFELVKRT